MPLNSQKEAETRPKSVSGIQCLRTVTKHLTKNIPIQIQGKQTAESFYEMLVSLAIHRQSVHSASKLFEKFPSESAIRYHLNKFTMDDLLSRSFTILWESAAACLPPGKAYEFAIDETTDPYYGKRDEKNLDHVISFVRKKSTNHFYGYYTLSVVSKNEKFILGVVPFLTSTSHKEMVQQLVSTLKIHQITPKVLYMG